MHNVRNKVPGVDNLNLQNSQNTQNNSSSEIFVSVKDRVKNYANNLNEKFNQDSTKATIKTVQAKPDSKPTVTINATAQKTFPAKTESKPIVTTNTIAQKKVPVNASSNIQLQTHQNPVTQKSAFSQKSNSIKPTKVDLKSKEKETHISLPQNLQDLKIAAAQSRDKKAMVCLSEGNEYSDGKKLKEMALTLQLLPENKFVIEHSFLDRWIETGIVYKGGNFGSCLGEMKELDEVLLVLYNNYLASLKM